MLEIDQTHMVAVRVTPEMAANAAATREGESYPSVLSTPALLSELERVSAALLEPLLTRSEVSVGVSVELRHLAPTPVGAELRSHARYLGRDGKLHLFEIWAEDDGGIVGKGRHSRAIVERAAIEARATTRRVPVVASATRET